jgi:mannose-6-phosphate isomerase-like protein (cupin superfamily)
MDTISLKDKFKLFQEYWTPKKIGELNGQQVLLAKLKGEFLWHTHDEEDELFMVVKGKLGIEFTDRTSYLEEGELCIIPKGTPHKPFAEEEVHVMLFEPLTIKHTGNISSERTVSHYESI